MDSVFFGVLTVVSVFAMASSYYQPYQKQPYYTPQYTQSPCRESVEDIKALIDISNSLKLEHHNCHNCNKIFGEDIIIKLIDALVQTATQNCYGKNNDTICHNNDHLSSINNTKYEPDDERNRFLTVDSLEEALLKLGVLNKNNKVDIDIRNTDVIGVNVDNKEEKNY